MATIQEILDKINASKSNNINNNSFIDLMRQISGNPEDATAPVNDTNSIYGHIVQMYTELFDGSTNYEEIVANIDAIRDVFNNLEIINSLNDIKAALESIFADKSTLDSIFADKLILDSLYTDKSTFDSLFADKIKFDRIYGSIDNIDRVYKSIDNIDTVIESAANIDILANDIQSVIATAVIDAEVVIVANSAPEIITLADNINTLNEIYTNRDEIYAADENAVIATTKAIEASNSATIATTKASEASASALAASTASSASTTKATESAASAVLANTSAGSANTSAASASSNATIATTKASEASVSASNASTSAATATTQAGISTTKANEASSSQVDALASKNSASASATIATAKASEASSSATTALTNKNLSDASLLLSKKEAWKAEAEKKTAESFASEPENVNAKTYISNDNGTFTATNTTKYSAMHWSAQASNLVLNGVIDDTTPKADRSYSSSKISNLLALKADKTQVLTDVPIGAKFTDTVYDDTTLANRVTTVETNKADKSQVLTNVPVGAKFTDTTYTVGAGLSLSGTVLANTAPNIVQTTVTGNAGSATKLETPRMINGVNFDGTANITFEATPTEHTHPAAQITGLGTAATQDSEAFISSGGIYGGENIDLKNNFLGRYDGIAGGPYTTSAVITYGNNANVVGQIATSYLNGETFVRGFDASWSAWRKIYDDKNTTTDTNGFLRSSGTKTSATTTDYATATVGGTVKVRLNGTTAYITTNGVDA